MTLLSGIVNEPLNCAHSSPASKRTHTPNTPTTPPSHSSCPPATVKWLRKKKKRRRSHKKKWICQTRHTVTNGELIRKEGEMNPNLDSSGKNGCSFLTQFSFTGGSY
ncbi:hypothetical protein BLNAU_13195 [Blattamonas nauphoetae]|uniref:Uncharacterized protein n=1 Tax=Blattamonas nauphoetae TaxID=2049346 RepID=A0ABQ9XKA4_9EUKA|nr:hypothetical protein BLNAU_13195 [Blattamonas nauphoetae]